MTVPTTTPDYTSRRTVTAATALPVTLATMKATLRLDNSDQDALLTASIWAASQSVEAYTGQTLTTTTFEAFWDDMPAVFQLPTNSPVQSIESIKYYDQDGTEQTLASDQYRADIYRQPARIEPAYGVSWPAVRNMANSVTVQYKAGHGDASTDVPAVLAAAVESQAVDIYEHPESLIVGTISGLNATAERLLASYKIAWSK